MTSVFISHTSGDDAFVDRIASALNSAGIDVWVDSGRIVPGDDIIEKIEQGLSNSSHIIVVFSPESLLSNWVREETHAAQLMAIARTARIIPVLYGAISPLAIPSLLRARLYVDFRKMEEFNHSISQLLAAFASNPTPDELQTSLEIIDIQIARRQKDNATAIEIFLKNSGRRVTNIRKVHTVSRISYSIDYHRPPPTVIYPLALTLGPRTANGVVMVGGEIGHESEEWRRPVIGQIVLAPYHTDFMMELPIYVAMGPQEEVILRIPIESFGVGEAEWKSWDAPTYQFAEFQARHDDGTIICIETSEGIASLVSPRSLLPALKSFVDSWDDDGLKNRFSRRLR